MPREVRSAVDKALDWLATEQKTDGTWPAGHGVTTSVPSLAVMAFLARGHVPGQGPYGDVMNKAIDFVLSRQKEDGLLSGNNGNAIMYEHGISILMLCQARPATDEARTAKIDNALKRAVRLIVDAQNPHGRPKLLPYTGGWRYRKASEDADLSVTGWQLAALSAAADSGVAVPKQTLDAGREFVLRCVDRRGANGGFSYQPGNGTSGTARTAFGTLALELTGEHGCPEARAGGDYLLEHPITGPDQQSFYFDAVYAASRALDRLGGRYADAGGAKLRDGLLASRNDQGFWPTGMGQEQEAGPAYRTSMAVLALCAPYHHGVSRPKDSPPTRPEQSP